MMDASSVWLWVFGAGSLAAAFVYYHVAMKNRMKNPSNE